MRVPPSHCLTLIMTLTMAIIFVHAPDVSAQASVDAKVDQPHGSVPLAVPTELPLLDPEAPLADMPDIGVDWPDLTQDDSAVSTNITDPSETDAQHSNIGLERRYSVKIEGLGDIQSGLITERFNALSALEQGSKKSANIAQIDRRAREDEELLATLLRSAGYYDSRVDTSVENDKDSRLTVILSVEPGPLYQFADVELRGLETTGDSAATLVQSFGVEAGDPVNADVVLAGDAALTKDIGQMGYPFAKVGEPAVIVDHDKRSATMVVDVDPGTKRNYGKIRIANDDIFSADHIQKIARFAPGDVYKADEMEDLRRALIATGLISSAKIAPVPGSTPETVDIAVTLQPAPLRTIAGSLGYSTGEGARAEVSWQHRNFFKPEGGITVRGVLGTNEQLLSFALRRNNAGARDRVFNAQVAASNVNRAAYDAETLSLSANLERQTNIIFQKKWTWSVGAELLLSDERDMKIGARRTYYIGAVPLNLAYDGSNDLLNPTSGFRVAIRLSPEASLQSGSHYYAKGQFDASGYFPVTDKIVLAARGRLGTMQGTPTSNIAPSRRFYAGGGGSVRGFGYQSIGPRDAQNNPIGGRGLAEFSLEARVRFGNIGIVPFIDGGNISDSGLPDFKDLRFGAGIGARYYSSFGPIRVDIGMPINRQKGDTRFAVYVSLGQAF